MSLIFKEWIVYIAIIIITLAVLLLCQPTIHITPKGIALPMTKEATQQIISNPQWHGTAKPTHWVNVEYHTTHDSAEAEQKVVDKMQSLATNAGAASVMMQPAFFAPSTIAKGMLSIIIGRGIALTPTPAPLMPHTK